MVKNMITVCLVLLFGLGQTGCSSTTTSHSMGMGMDHTSHASPAAAQSASKEK